MDEPVPPKSPEAPALETADRLLAKYVAVWLWTVFFGLNSGLTYNYLSAFTQNIPSSRFIGGPRPQGDLIFAWAIANGVGAMATIGGWLFAYFFFSVYLLPVVFLGVTAVSEERRRRDAARFLNRAYLLLLLAGVARLAPELMLLVGPLLTGF